MLLLLLLLLLVVKTISAHVLPGSLTLSFVHTPRRVQFGETALNRAAINQKWNVAKMLLERNANPNSASKVRPTLALSAPVPALGLECELGSCLVFSLVIGLGVGGTDRFRCRVRGNVSGRFRVRGRGRSRGKSKGNGNGEGKGRVSVTIRIN